MDEQLMFFILGFIKRRWQRKPTTTFSRAKYEKKKPLLTTMKDVAVDCADAYLRASDILAGKGQYEKVWQEYVMGYVLVHFNNARHLLGELALDAVEIGGSVRDSTVVDGDVSSGKLHIQQHFPGGEARRIGANYRANRRANCGFTYECPGISFWNVQAIYSLAQRFHTQTSSSPPPPQIPTNVRDPKLPKLGHQPPSHPLQAGQGPHGGSVSWGRNMASHTEK